EDEDGWAIGIFLEVLYDLLSFLNGYTAVNKGHFDIKLFGELIDEQLSHLCVLRKDQRAFAFCEHFFEHLDQTGELSRSSSDLFFVPVLEVVRGVVADLFECGEQCKDASTPRHTRTAFDAFERGIDRGLIQGRLLACEHGVDLVLLLLRKILEDGWVGLHAAQDKGCDHAPEHVCNLSIAEALDRQCKAATEISRRSK